jgi:hypothetical protein
MLHNEERYIASIPLLLSQTEGIFAQEMKSMLFSEHDQRKKNIEQTLEGNEDGFLGSFLGSSQISGERHVPQIPGA